MALDLTWGRGVHAVFMNGCRGGMCTSTWFTWYHSCPHNAAAIIFTIFGWSSHSCYYRRSSSLARPSKANKFNITEGTCNFLILLKFWFIKHRKTDLFLLGEFLSLFLLDDADEPPAWWPRLPGSIQSSSSALSQPVKTSKKLRHLVTS